MRVSNRTLLLILLLPVFTLKGIAQEEKYIGLFLYNFTKYFDWPESAKTGDFVIEIIGHQSVADELTRLTAGKKIGSQAIKVRHLSNVSEMSGQAHIIFVGHWQSRFMPDVITGVGKKPVLLITEMEGMLDKGAAINFIIRDGAIKFEMKTSNITACNLKTDQRIRELAYRVVD